MTVSADRTRPSSYKEDFFLPADYYKPVPLWISVLWVPFQWVVLPILSYNPDLLDPFLSDHYEHIADVQKRNIMPLFIATVWVNAIQGILAARQCRHRGLNAHTTLHWIINVGIHGFFSLRYLIWPDKSLPHIKVH